jgi:hypothetical protein
MRESCLPTPQAIQHLNLEVYVTPSGHCISAKTRNKTVLDDAVTLEFIESYHAEYGLTFSILRDVWLGHLAAKAAMLSDPIQCQCPQNNPSEVYDIVYSALGGRTAAFILWAVHAPQKSITGSSALMLQSFEALAKAFTDTHKVLVERNK